MWDLGVNLLDTAAAYGESEARTDYLDVVLVHSDGRDTAILAESDALDTLNALKQAGSIRAVGFSHKTAAGGRAALAQCDVIMTALSHSDRSQRDVVREAGVGGCGVLIKKPLDSGGAAPETLSYVAAQPGVSSIVVGTTNLAHLEADVESVLG